MKHTYKIILFLLLFLPVWSTVYAGVMTFNPTTKSVNVGDTFTVDVNIDPGTDKLFGVQAFVLYDKNLLEAQSVTAGTYFPTVTKNIIAGKVYISGDTQIGSPVSGTGTLATITFKALTGGSATVSYLCDLNSTDTSVIGKNDASSTNVIECSRNGTLAVTISGSGIAPTTTPSSTTTSSSTTVQTTPPATLPRSGGIESVVFFSIAGTALIFLGGAARMILRFI